MAADVRMRKAWLRWVIELEHTEKGLAAVIRNNLSVRIAVRKAFDAGYRARRRDNDLGQKACNIS